MHKTNILYKLLKIAVENGLDPTIVAASLEI